MNVGGAEAPLPTIVVIAKPPIKVVYWLSGIVRKKCRRPFDRDH